METVYERLRTWRWNLAKELNVPSYLILSNAYLANVARAMPATLEELAACPGLGPKKVAQFGEELLALVAACRAEGLEPGVLPVPAPAETLGEGDVAEILAGLRRELARQVTRSFKGRYTPAQVEAVLARLTISA
ncbi:MAG TPA: HRDC domain-containing protein [Symbiobacteriaceae bacterium]|nr:HRDC domain-containing protein [Symbiobacteriaceae bacterium]